MVNLDGTYLLPEIIDKLRSRGITIKAVNLKKPSMDDVFVHYTGRELRDTGTEKGSVVSLRTGGVKRCILDFLLYTGEIC